MVLTCMGGLQCASQLLSASLPLCPWLCEVCAFFTADFQMREEKGLPHDRPGL